MSCGHCRDLPATHPLPAARCLLQPEAGSRKPRLRRASGGGGIRTLLHTPPAPDWPRPRASPRALRQNNTTRTESWSDSEKESDQPEGQSGGGGIRTHGTPEGSTVFKTVAFVRSATPPHRLPALGFRLEAGGG